MQPSEADKDPGSPTLINAFQLIGMSSCLDLSGFFEKEVKTSVNVPAAPFCLHFQPITDCTNTY